MKSRLLLLFIFFGQILSAQTFTEVMETPFDEVTQSSIAFADVDGDNDQDVLITGETNSSSPIAKLYINDGLGNYNEVIGTPFEPVSNGFIAFADIDGDADQDVLITGDISSSNPIAKLYINDGLGNYSEVTETPFEPVSSGSIAFADVDGDADQDVLIAGRKSTNISIAKLYTNDGLGNYSEVAGTSFQSVSNGSIAFADVDGDADQDVFILGLLTGKLYINDGLGNYSEVTGTSFSGVPEASVAFTDIDGDQDQDLLIAGIFMIKLYTNDGLGNYNEMTQTPFDIFSESPIAFVDIDGDNDQDLLTSSLSKGKLYTNDGLGNYSEVAGTSFPSIPLGSIAFADIDGDQDQDLLMTGGFSPDQITKLYTNDNIVTPIEDVKGNLNFEIVLYPNPSTVKNINVSYTSATNTSDIKIFDLNGRLVQQYRKSIETGEQNFSLDIAALQKGNYILQVTDGVRKGVQKFLVQ